ncbi:MAG: DUF374 domain-containing protein [Bdellovibrio sp.]
MFLKKIRAWILGFLIWIVYRLLSWTWTLKIEEPAEMQRLLRESGPLVLAHWHGDELALIHLSRRYRIATMVSQSSDGALMNVVLRLLGACTTRGSSSRGSVGGLKGLFTLVRQGHPLSFAVDGPRGPRHEVKPGVFEMSRVLSAPIYAGQIYCDRFWISQKSWNKAILPKPFAQLSIRWVELPVRLTKDDDPRDPRFSEALKARLLG